MKEGNFTNFVFYHIASGHSYWSKLPHSRLFVAVGNIHFFDIVHPTFEKMHHLTMSLFTFVYSETEGEQGSSIIWQIPDESNYLVADLVADLSSSRSSSRSLSEFPILDQIYKVSNIRPVH